VLLLDEPLSALDARTRAEVRGDLRRLLRELEVPALLVTHDFEDAAALADRIGVLVEGRLLQLGTAAELVSAPADRFVAEFAGANVLLGTARSGGGGLTEVTLDGGGGVVYSTDEAHGRVAAVVYPWDVSVALHAADDSALNHLDGAVESVLRLGNRVRVRIGPVVSEVTAASADRLGVHEGGRAHASFKATATRLVPVEPGYARTRSAAE
jgi:molybdate transport system ATP-binding protein